MNPEKNPRYAWYDIAEEAFPKKAMHIASSAYYLGKIGRLMESIEKNKSALKLDPKNYEILNDLGYTLLEAERFDEAEQYLKQAISLAPEDYELARNNLEHLKEMKASYLKRHKEN